MSREPIELDNLRHFVNVVCDLLETSNDESLMRSAEGLREYATKDIGLLEDRINELASDDKGLVFE